MYIDICSVNCFYWLVDEISACLLVAIRGLFKMAFAVYCVSMVRIVL